MKLININPYIRYVNNYSPDYSYTEKERVIYDYEFMYIMSGSVVMNYNGNQYFLQKGDLFYLKPGIKNNIIVDGSIGLKTHCIHFDWEPPEEMFDFTAEEFYTHSVLSENHQEKKRLLIDRPHNEPSDFNLCPYNKGLSFSTFAPLFERCYREFIINSQSSLLNVRAVFLEIIALLADSLNEKTNIPTIHPKIAQAIEYIKKNYNNHLSVSYLSEKYELSPKYFGKLFHLATGKSVNSFITELRIFAAKEMLIGTDMTIEEIALASGFCDSFYFSKCFKQYEKLPPSHYRDIMQKDWKR